MPEKAVTWPPRAPTWRSSWGNIAAAEAREHVRETVVSSCCRNTLQYFFTTRFCSKHAFNYGRSARVNVGLSNHPIAGVYNRRDRRPTKCHALPEIYFTEKSLLSL